MIIQRLLPAQVNAIGDREFRAIVSNSDRGRDGLRVLTAGLDFTEYLKNPVLLFSHLPTEPIGRCTALRVVGDDLIGRFEFAPPGISATADRACGLLKNFAGLNSLSIGFEIVEIGAPQKGVRTVSKAVLMEISVVAIPSLPSAQVIERAFREKGDRAKELLATARRHIAEGHGHLRAIGDGLDRNNRRGAERAHAYAVRANRGADRALEELDRVGMDDVALRPPGGHGIGLSDSPKSAATKTLADTGAGPPRGYRPSEPIALAGWLAGRAAAHARDVSLAAAARPTVDRSFAERQAAKARLGR